MASHHSNNGLSFVVKRYLHETTLKVLMHRFDTPHTLAFFTERQFWCQQHCGSSSTKWNDVNIFDDHRKDIVVKKVKSYRSSCMIINTSFYTFPLDEIEAVKLFEYMVLYFVLATIQFFYLSYKSAKRNWTNRHMLENEIFHLLMNLLQLGWKAANAPVIKQKQESSIILFA